MKKRKIKSDVSAFMRELIREVLSEKTEVPQDPDIKSRKGTQPAKYYKGLSKSTKVARAKHFEKQDSYGDAPGDKGAKTKPSKYTAKFKKMFGEDVLNEVIALIKEEDKVSKALKNKAKKANAPVSALRAIYNKGLAAYKTGHRPGASQHAWGMARVNSVLTGGKAREVDATQWKQIQKHRSKKK